MRLSTPSHGLESPELAAALDYAAHGISVVPLHDPTTGRCSCAKGSACASSGKHPRLDWKPYQERCADADEIRAWWDCWPAANVSIVTGTISQLCVLDIDPRNGGLETLVELDYHGGQIPDDNPLVIHGPRPRPQAAGASAHARAHHRPTS